jgi:hypothetical protein
MPSVSHRFPHQPTQAPRSVSSTYPGGSIVWRRGPPEVCCLDLARSKRIAVGRPRQHGTSRRVDVFQHGSTDRARILIIFARSDKSGSLSSPVMTYGCLRAETLDDSALAHRPASGNRRAGTSGARTDWSRPARFTSIGIKFAHAVPPSRFRVGSGHKRRQERCGRRGANQRVDACLDRASSGRSRGRSDLVALA